MARARCSARAAQELGAGRSRRARPSRRPATGVAARASAAKSTSVTSTSCPTALTTGTAARGDGAHHRLVVERREVVGRAAAAADDDDVDPATRWRPRERAADGLGGVGALHLRGREQDARAAAPERHAADVVDDRARRARDDADDARLARAAGACAPAAKSPSAASFALSRSSASSSAPRPARLHAVGDELQPAPRRPEGGPASQADARPVDAERPHPGRHVRAVHDDVDRRVLLLVLEAEVEVAARRRAGVR